MHQALCCRCNFQPVAVTYFLEEKQMRELPFEAPPSGFLQQSPGLDAHAVKPWLARDALQCPRQCREMPQICL